MAELSKGDCRDIGMRRPIPPGSRNTLRFSRGKKLGMSCDNRRRYRILSTVPPGRWAYSSQGPTLDTQRSRRSVPSLAQATSTSDGTDRGRNVKRRRARSGSQESPQPSTLHFHSRVACSMNGPESAPQRNTGQRFRSATETHSAYNQFVCGARESNVMVSLRES